MMRIRLPAGLVLAMTIAACAAPAPAQGQDAEVPADPDGRSQALREEIAFDKARLELARGKAFYLIVDAPAKTVTLEMNGVPLRVCPIERLELDRRMMQRRKSEGFSDSLAVPFKLMTRSGTIPDTPPPVDADTTRTKEAEKARQKARYSDADLSLAFDRNLIVHITTRGDSTELVKHGPVKTRLLNRWRLLRLMLRSWTQEGGPFREQGEIFLQIGRTDARALYWALPDSAGLALRL